MTRPHGDGPPVNQWVIGSYLDSSKIIGRVEHLHVSTTISDPLPSVDELTNQNLQRATERLLACLKSRDLVPTVIDRLSVVPAERVVGLLVQLHPRDPSLCGAVLLYMGERQCRQFLTAMTDSQRKTTMRCAVEHLCRRVRNGGAADAANTLVHTDLRLAADLLEMTPAGCRAAILRHCRPADRTSLLNGMAPASVYELVAPREGQSGPVPPAWIGAMRPERIAAALAGAERRDEAEAPARAVAVTVVRALNAAQGPPATAEMLARAALPGSWADAVLSGVGRESAADVLTQGRRLGRTWVRLLRPSTLAGIALAVGPPAAARLLEPVEPRPLVATLAGLPPDTAVAILTEMPPATVAAGLAVLPREQVPGLLGPGGRRRRARAGQARERRAGLLVHAEPQVAGRLLAGMSPADAAWLLAGLPHNRKMEIVTRSLDRAPSWLCAMPQDSAIDVLSGLGPGHAAAVLTALPSVRAISLLAMSRSEILEFENDRLRAAQDRAVEAAAGRQLRLFLRTQREVLRLAGRLFAASRIPEEKPMAVSAPGAATALWESLDPPVRERLSAEMSDVALRRLR